MTNNIIKMIIVIKNNLNIITISSRSIYYLRYSVYDVPKYWIIAYSPFDPYNFMLHDE